MYALPKDLCSRRSFPEESLGTFSPRAATKPSNDPVAVATPQSHTHPKPHRFSSLQLTT
jgi:hypothetical protein